MTRIKDLHKKWMKDPEYRREYDLLEEEFASALHRKWEGLFGEVSDQTRRLGTPAGA